MNFTYQGTTTAQYGQNNTNTVGFGDTSTTGCGYGALACTATWRSGSTIVEADTRLWNGVTWYNGAQAGKYDVQHAMAHETGHAIGFGESYTDCTVVMCAYGSTNNTSNRLLGRGDANADNAKY